MLDKEREDSRRDLPETQVQALSTSDVRLRADDVVPVVAIEKNAVHAILA